MKQQTVQHLIDAKVAAGAAVSSGGALVAWAEAAEPVVAVLSGAVAIVAGVLTIIYTGIRIYDWYKKP